MEHQIDEGDVHSEPEVDVHHDSQAEQLRGPITRAHRKWLEGHKMKGVMATIERWQNLKGGKCMLWGA